MKKRLSIGIICLLMGCSAWMNTEHLPFEQEGHYRIMLADYLVPADTSLHPDKAVQQFQNKARDICLLIRKEPLQRLAQRNPAYTLIDCYDGTITTLLPNLDPPTVAPEPDSMSLDSLNALVGTLEGGFKGDRLHYKLAVIEGQEFLYQLLCWTSLPLLPRYEADMNQMIYSFEGK